MAVVRKIGMSDSMLSKKKKNGLAFAGDNGLVHTAATRNSIESSVCVIQIWRTYQIGPKFLFYVITLCALTRIFHDIEQG